MRIRTTKALEDALAKGIFKTKREGSGTPVDRTFLALLEDNNNHATHVLGKVVHGWELQLIYNRVKEELKVRSGSNNNIGDYNDIYNKLTPSLEQISSEFYYAEGAAVNSGHFLLYILRNKQYVSSRVMAMFGITDKRIATFVGDLPADESYYEDMNALRNIHIIHVNQGKQESDNDNETEYVLGDIDIETDKPTANNDVALMEFLGKFGTDITEAARNGEIDPVIGRDKEIARLTQILGRRKKNNPILVGEAGVGKSAIVEGLALRIVAGDVPPVLHGKTVFSLDISSLVAGTKYRGEFEERMNELISKLKKNKDIILFIDEIHTIAGAGSTQGSLDTANILKPALARGEIQCIGATTLDEFRENIENDSALERRFQKIMVEPSSKEETLKILTNIKGHYEHYHSVRYSDEAIRACVDLTDRYVTDRHFPDKAIDVLDEAGSKASIFESKKPELLSELEKSAAETARKKMKAAEAKDYDTVTKAHIKETALSEEAEKVRTAWMSDIGQNPRTIHAEHIEEVVSSMTGIPVKNVSQDEKSRLRSMSSHLSSLVVGQSEAVDKVTRSIQRSRAGLKDPNKPIGVFMFVGPTGVGKTLLAKELSKWIFNRNDALIRIDMSEYSEKHNVSRLIGSPPGYVGYGEGGQLTEAVRRQPYAVILFDEIEKAHSDVFNIMLQIFDEGHLTDGLGRRIDFRNTVIIMTSNAGTREVSVASPVIGYDSSETVQLTEAVTENGYRKALEEQFAPEFINRIDDVVIFNTLDIENVKKIVDLELKQLYDRAGNMGYKMTVTKAAKNELARIGFEPRYGVRSLKRTILEHVEEPLAEMIVEEKVSPGDKIKIDLCRNRITLAKADVKCPAGA